MKIKQEELFPQLVSESAAESFHPELGPIVSEVLKDPLFESKSQLSWHFIQEVINRYNQQTGGELLANAQEFEEKLFFRLVKQIDKILEGMGRQLHPRILAKTIPAAAKKAGQRRRKNKRSTQLDLV
ncbi:hypothetical protein D6821_00905 [Candidatus Parcubacteria bacterium]|nr:MAG: hypothetical protein D6821_00905 [Candidatus Parcubacteria bacterium]